MKTSTFQYAILGIFGLLILAGLGVFAASGNLTGSGGGTGAVVIWGTAPQAQMDTLLGALRAQDKTFTNVTYVAQDAATYESTLVNAMAAGAGPDLFMLDQRQVSEFTNKLLVIPYSSYSQGTFASSFIDEATLFLTPQGVRALPFSVDPLVMYWNKDLFASAGLASPPQYWSDLITIAPKITSLDASKDVTQSAAALGEWSNVVHAKDILSALMLQAGDSITAQAQNGSLTATLGSEAAGAAESPAASALRFYTEFADPTKSDYSWNRSLPESTDAFAGGQVALYFGFASEYQSLLARNPNLNIAVAALPQLSSTGTHLTYGDLTGLAISRTAHNVNGALAVAEALSGQAAVGTYAQETGLPPVRRDISLNISATAASQVFAQSALIAHGWLDPSPAQTDTLFRTMIESVISGAADPSQAVSTAAQGLQGLTGQNAIGQ